MPKRLFGRFADRLLSRFIQPSTRAYWNEFRKLPNRNPLTWLHGYAYGRWPYVYIGVAKGDHPLSRLFTPLVRLFTTLHPTAPDAADTAKLSWADSYHGKVVPPDEARQLLRINRPVELRVPEKVIPYKAARDIVLKNPEKIALLDCPCRASMKNPCLPLDVCLIVGDPFASFVVEHMPDKARFITRERAVEVLRECHARGNVHHAFFKEAVLDRFYAICNCCSCCCGAMMAQRHGIPMLCSSGYFAKRDQDLCVGCGKCKEYCQFEAITIKDGKSRIGGSCMGCGVCVSKCPKRAIRLVRAPGKGEPLRVHDLMAERGIPNGPETSDRAE